MRKLLSLMAGIILACTVFTTSAEARVYGGVYLGAPSIYVGPGYGYGYYPYYRTYYYGNGYYGNRYYYPHRYYRPYRHYRHYRNW